MTEEKLVFIQLPPETSREEAGKFAEFFKANKPEGYTFVIADNWHAFTKEEFQPFLKMLKEKLGAENEM